MSLAAPARRFEGEDFLVGIHYAGLGVFLVIHFAYLAFDTWAEQRAPDPPTG